MKIYLGTDHAGYVLKESIKEWLKNNNHEVEDKGAFELESTDDYNDFILSVARAVSEDPKETKGIIFGGSGQGEAIQANKIENVRAVVFYGGDLEIIRLGRKHNNSNILSLGARFLSDQEAKNAIKLWLEEPFSNDERHIRRNNKIDETKN